MQKIIQRFEQIDDEILQGDDVCCRLIPADLVEQLLPKLADDGCLKLVSGENAVSICNKHNLDGVIVGVNAGKPVKKQIDVIKKTLGKKYIGVACSANRHEAMLCSECEPDFLIFEANLTKKSEILSIVPWYNELFLIQCALDIQDLCDEYMALDTDFIIVNAKNGKNFGC